MRGNARMKKIVNRGIASITILLILAFFAACSSGSSDESGSQNNSDNTSREESYSAASISGAWILESDSSAVRHYLITDGSGTLTNWSMNGGGAGTYYIDADGSFIFRIGGSDIKGKLFLASSVKGTISFECCGDWRINKVSDLSVCTGDWQGVISDPGASRTFRVIVSVDSQGVITSVDGLGSEAEGRMISLKGEVAAFIEYGDEGQTIAFSATRNGDAMSGKAFFDADGSQAGSVSLERVEYSVENAASLLLDLKGARKGLIINGDDLSMGDFANSGIFSAWDTGAITSISLFTVTMAIGIDGQPVQGDPFAEAIEGIKMRPGIDVGCHLTLSSTDGFMIRPVLPPEQIPTLVDKDGYLKESYINFLFASRDEIRAEARAQIDKALASGVKLSHLDCHVGWGHITGTMKDLYTELGDEYRLPLRWVLGTDDEQRLFDHRVLVPKKFVGLSDTGIKSVTPEAFTKRKQFMLRTLKNLPDGITEVLCHPGLEAPEGQVWRIIDYMVLTDPEVRAQIESMCASGELVMLGFNDLRKTMERL
jgi:predicted glycoside hydrolase/deacetylase ChbG (UPF0249 family)